MFSSLRVLLPLLLALAWSAPVSALPGSGLGRPNVVVILVDDLGIDNVGYYRAHPRPAKTPHIDHLASQGAVFWNAYANPVCTPSRVALLTGRYGSHPDIRMGHAVKGNSTSGGLDPNLMTLAKAVGPAYRRVALGKWHVSDGSQVQEPISPAVRHGFDVHSLTWFNLNQGGQGYYNYDKRYEDGTSQTFDRYATTEFVDEAIDHLQDDSQPLLLYLALHAPHSPFEAPPAHLHSVDTSSGTPEVIYKAMVEALDTELGRFLGALDASPMAGNTYVFFLSDNGTPKEVTLAPWDGDKAKSSPYEGGVRVPFIVRGPGVHPRRVGSLVHLVDVMPTVLSIAGRPAVESEGVSLVPLLAGHTPRWPKLMYSEAWHLNGFPSASQHRRMARNARYSLLAFHNSPDELYDLHRDPRQEDNLLVGGVTGLGSLEFQGYAELRRYLNRIRPGFWQ